MKKDKVTLADLSKDSEYVALQKEQLSLCLTQQKRDLERSRIQIMSDRIEQARRNVEVITRVINGFAEGKPTYTKMHEVLMENLEILKEVKNLR